MTDIKEITKPETKHLDHVFNYMNRSIGVRFIKNISDLEDNWENAQYELSAEYQYEGINENIWDYYLVYCCNFDEVDLDNILRFKVESDRFCCRKHFLFGMSRSSFSKEYLVAHLFPLLNSSKPIRIITADTILDKFDEKLRILVPPSFFTEELDASETESLFKTLISEIEDTDGR